MTRRVQRPHRATAASVPRRGAFLGRLVPSTLAVILVLLVPSAASAITYGQPDNGQHPNVGSFVVEYTDPETGQTVLAQACTGTLISDDLVLSASHCFSDLPPEIGDVWFTLAEVIDENRDGIVDPSVGLLPGVPFTHPLYGTGGQSNTYDIAVFRLDAPVTGVAPASLPPLRYLDGRDVRRETFTAVGYGTVRVSQRQGPQGFQVGWRREKADQHLLAVTKAWSTFSMNLATGNGGTCYGDSGGPHLVGDMVVSITVTGDTMCKATDTTYRVDTPWARDFLSLFVELP